jgi:hypothetical protein
VWSIDISDTFKVHCVMRLELFMVVKVKTTILCNMMLFSSGRYKCFSRHWLIPFAECKNAFLYSFTQRMKALWSFEMLRSAC